MTFNTCPRCHNQIGIQRQNQLPVVCDWCGYVATITQKKSQRKLESSLTMAISIFSIGVVLLFTHFLSWGTYSFEIPALQIMKITGMASVQTLERYSEICLNLGKYDCVEETEAQLGQLNVEYIGRLGIFQVKRKEWRQADTTFREYFAKGGKDLEAEYGFAKTLNELGQVDDAARYYEFVLAQKPSVIQTTVLTNYIKMLMDHGRLDQANTVIEGYRKRKIVADNFMEKELEEIHKRLGKT